MPIIPIHSLDDPRIAPYRNLKDRDLAREGGRFIAEGELVVRRLVSSPFVLESILCARKKVQEMASIAPEGVPVYAATAEVVNQIVGFKFHSGVMAVGIRGHGWTLDELFHSRQGTLTLLVCPQIEKSDNLGSLVRIAAGLGAAGMLLGPQCCDPFYRQSVRVSMGAVFSLPIVRSDDLLTDLHRLREEFDVDLVASVLADDAESLQTCGRRPRCAIVLGNETQGLSPRIIAACNRKVTIPMGLGTDSLNVSVAAGVFLYHFTRVAAVRL